MKLYAKYVKMLIRCSAQYKLTFVLTILGQLANSIFSFLSIYFLFDRFGNVEGYTLGEVALCFSVILMAFSITECYARGLDRFAQQIVSGNFDRLLVRPRSLVLQVFGTEFAISRIGRLFYALVALILATQWLDTVWTSGRILTVVLMIVGGIAIFTGLFFLGAALCFVTIQGLEVVNIFTDGGRELASYPIDIFGKHVARFFTFIIPWGCINYLPLTYVAGHNENQLFALLPLAGILFLIPCIFVWHIGVRRYVSTGS